MDNPFYKSGPDARSDATRRPGADLPIEHAAPVPVLMKPQTLPPPSRRTPVAVVVAGLLHGLAWGQEGDVEALKLNRTPQLEEKIPPQTRKDLPTFVSGQRLEGQVDQRVVVEGEAELRNRSTVMRGDWLQYTMPDDTARGRGKVRLNREGNVYQAPEGELEIDAFRGHLKSPSFELLKNGALGDAERLDFLDDKRSILHNARYSTCRRDGPEWLPDWVLKARRIDVDLEDDTGVAEGATLRFMDVPILPVPEISFPLSGKRKTGFLTPTVGLGNVNGVEYSQPYYLNLAPNRDATLWGTVMSKRGVDLAGEYRYLEEPYKGQVWGNFMPWDRLRDEKRWGFAGVHNGTLPGGSALSVNLNRVSDDNYWKDFPRIGTSQTTRLLPNDANLTWSQGGFSTAARALYWQTLQDPTAPITPPYNRLPQLTARYGGGTGVGIDYSVNADYTKFESLPAMTGQPNGQRTFIAAQVSRPWTQPGGFITPKLMVQATNYTVDGPLSNGDTRANVTVPTVSLDSGLIFERDASYFGRELRQTLEPRAFYVYTPYRNQNYLPNYDTASFDYNFTTIYQENAFVGNDRIADNNLLTLGLSSRLLDPASGSQAAQFGIANRLRFSSQQVTLPGQAAVPSGWSDILVGGIVNWDPRWSARAVVQFDAKTASSVRTTVGGTYNPGNYRVFNAAYRLQAGTSESLDVSWQWPINDLWGDRGQELGAGKGQGPGRWYTVGRMSYSLMNRQLTDGLLGFEYDAGCWLTRIVVTRLQTSSTTANTSVTMQLELVGFSRLGTSPLKTLRDQVSRYQYLRDQSTPPPSRFSNYE